MIRLANTPRPDWRARVEKFGLLFHTENGRPYWNEEAYYQFTASEIAKLERATNELHAMCLSAVQHVIDRDRFHELGIPQKAVSAIKATWESEPPSLYGRFDLAFDGTGEPKMLEYNADTPTSLLEAAVIQWHWLQDVQPSADQFNSIWEGLVELWRELKNDRHLKGHVVHFAHQEEVEDIMTVAVLQDTAQEAGLAVKPVLIEQLGWNERERYFVDLEELRIRSIFKLYPWEWMLADEFAEPLLSTMEETQWMEPIWKMVLSNKGILPILWELNPGHPYLLPAYFDGPRDLAEYVKKPLLAREGSNVTIHAEGATVSADGPYGDEGYVFQAFHPLARFDDVHAVIGSWVVDGVARGIGVRESDGPITDNLARFMPHLF